MENIWDLFIKAIQDILQFFYGLSQKAGAPSYGVAIILLTVTIKAMLYPLTLKQIQSTKAMQAMQPRMKVLQAKYKNDKVRLQQEMANLYKETGFNPLSGCLPLLAQMPLLIGFFYALKDFNYGNTTPSFLWLPSLAQPDPLYIMPVLSALTTMLQSYQTMPDTSGQNKALLYLMPIFIGYISLQFPAGLVLYWVVNNILQAAQQSYINYRDKKA